MNNDVMKAILAMDAYNRGYDVGIDGLGGLGSAIGNATLSSQSDTEAGDLGVSAGFYAVSYVLNAGTANEETIISYRGTDKNFVWPWNESGSDLANGYGVGGGSPFGVQAELAIVRTCRYKRRSSCFSLVDAP